MVRLCPYDPIDMHSHSLAANAPRLLLADLKRSKGKPELPDAGPKPKAEPKNAPKGPKGPKGKGKAKPSANGDDQ